MSDVDEERYREITGEDTPDTAGDEESRAQVHPEQEAHGGSMAPGSVDDTGHRLTGEPDR